MQMPEPLIIRDISGIAGYGLALATALGQLHRFKKCKVVLRGLRISCGGATLDLAPRAYPIWSWKESDMSKENALSFLQQAATNPDLKSQVQGAEEPSQVINLGETQGFAFSPDHVREVIPDLKAQRSFLGI